MSRTEIAQVSQQTFYKETVKIPCTHSRIISLKFDFCNNPRITNSIDFSREARRLGIKEIRYDLRKPNTRGTANHRAGGGLRTSTVEIRCSVSVIVVTTETRYREPCTISRNGFGSSHHKETCIRDKGKNRKGKEREKTESRYSTPSRFKTSFLGLLASSERKLVCRNK